MSKTAHLGSLTRGCCDQPSPSTISKAGLRLRYRTPVQGVALFRDPTAGGDSQRASRSVCASQEAQPAVHGAAAEVVRHGRLRLYPPHLEVVMNDNCSRCKQDYDFRAESDRVFIFIQTPKYCYIVAHCPRCDWVTRLFCPPEVCVAALSVGLAISVGLEADPDTVGAYLECHIVEPHEFGLTPRMEEEVGGLHTTLEVIPEQLFWDIMHSPAPHDKPQRWIEDEV